MFEKTNVSGKFLAIKGDCTHFIIGQLQTPIGVEDVAALRFVIIYLDITSVKFSTSDTINVSIPIDDII